MPDEITPCQAALWFASQGFPTFPLHSVTDGGACTCGATECSTGKHPFAEYAPHGFKDATTDAATIRGWFAKHYWLNYGVGTDRLLVIDVDVKHGGTETWKEMCGQPTRALPHTWQVRTGGGGLHVIFDNTEAKIRCGEIAAGIQIKAIGGYIVGVTSKHESGRTYEWAPQCSPKDAPLAAPPDWLLAVIKTRTHCGKPTSTEEWRKLARTCLADGARHAVFLRIAGHLISNPLKDPVEIRELMLGWNRGMCDPPLTENDCLQMLENIAARELAKGKWL